MFLFCFHVEGVTELDCNFMVAVLADENSKKFRQFKKSEDLEKS